MRVHLYAYVYMYVVYKWCRNIRRDYIYSPILSSLSYKVTLCPRCAAVTAHARPDGPAPITAIFITLLLITRVICSVDS